MKGIIELDIRGAKEKADQAARAEAGESDDTRAGANTTSAAVGDVEMRDEEVEEEDQEELGSDYEEVEVTDDEGEGDDGEGDRPSKRQRTEEDAAEDEDEAMEFTEADFAAQLQAMGEDYGLEPGDYDDGNAEEWPEGAEGVPFIQNGFTVLLNGGRISWVSYLVIAILLDYDAILAQAKEVKPKLIVAGASAYSDFSQPF